MKASESNQIITKELVENLIHYIGKDTTEKINEVFDLPPREGDTMTDEEGSWYFEDGEWWLE